MSVWPGQDGKLADKALGLDRVVHMNPNILTYLAASLRHTRKYITKSGVPSSIGQLGHRLTTSTFVI